MPTPKASQARPTRRAADFDGSRAPYGGTWSGSISSGSLPGREGDPPASEDPTNQADETERSLGRS